MLVQIAEHRFLPAAKGVVGQWHRDWHVDADHADIDARGKLTRGVTIAGEYGNAIAILIMFLCGWGLGKYAGRNSFLTGITMSLFGIVLVLIAIVLGG